MTPIRIRTTPAEDGHPLVGLDELFLRHQGFPQHLPVGAAGQQAGPLQVARADRSSPIHPLPGPYLMRATMDCIVCASFRPGFAG